MQQARGPSRHPALRSAVLLLWLVDVLIASFGVTRAVGRADGSGDFQWSAAHLLAHGTSAYDASLHGSPSILLQQGPNYLPLLYFVLLPFGVVAFSLARIGWAILNVVMFAAAGAVLGRAVGLRGWPLSGFIGLIFCSDPLVNAVGNGQQTALVLLAAVVAFRAHRSAVAGTALALTVTKYSFAPLAVVLLVGRRWSAAVVAAAVSVVALIAFCAVTGSPVIDAAVGPLRVARSMARGAGDVMTLSGIAIGRDSWITYAVTGLAWAGLTWLVGRAVTRSDWVDSLACGSLISLLVLPHLVYDYCFLLPVVASAVRAPGWTRWARLAAVAWLWYGWLLGGTNIAPYRLPGVLETMAVLLVAFAAQVVASTRWAGAGGIGDHQDHGSSWRGRRGKRAHHDDPWPAT